MSRTERRLEVCASNVLLNHSLTNSLLDIIGFENSVRAQKLTISDEGYTIEAGVSLLGSDGAELIICAAAFPCHLFISGINQPPQNVIPEYPLEKYSWTDIA